MQPLFCCGKREPASGGDGNGLLRRRKGGLCNDLCLTLTGNWSVFLRSLDSNLIPE